MVPTTPRRAPLHQDSLLETPERALLEGPSLASWQVRHSPGGRIDPTPQTPDLERLLSRIPSVSPPPSASRSLPSAKAVQGKTPSEEKTKKSAFQTLGLLYRFTHTKTGKKYYGSTIGEILKKQSKQGIAKVAKKRFSGYRQELRREKRPRCIIAALQQSPEKFKVSIVWARKGIDERGLLERESRLQRAGSGSFFPKGYNVTDARKEPLRTTHAKEEEKKPRAACTLFASSKKK